MGNNNHWKTVEKKVMQALGGQRTGPAGYGRAVEDGHAGQFSAEIKHRADIPNWLKDALSQAENNAPAGSLPILVIHPKHARYTNSLVVLRLNDFQEWFGEIQAEESEACNE